MVEIHQRPDHVSDFFLYRYKDEIKRLHIYTLYLTVEIMTKIWTGAIFKSDEY